MHEIDGIVIPTSSQGLPRSVPLDWLKRHPGNELASSVFDLPRSNLARTLATINALLREVDGKQCHAVLVGVHV